MVGFSGVRSGGRAIVFELNPVSLRSLNAALADRTVASVVGSAPLSVFPSLGNFVGVCYHVRGGAPFRDLPSACLAGATYALVLTSYSLSEAGKVYAGAFTSKRQPNGQSSFVWWSDLQSLTLGSGLLVLCQFRVASRLHDGPVARLLLRNLIEPDALS